MPDGPDLLYTLPSVPALVHKTQFDGVQDKRLKELYVKEYEDVLCSRRSVPLRMNPESKTPLPKMTKSDGFRLLVMGHLEPDEWATGAHDVPCSGGRPHLQSADGCWAGYARLKGTLENRKCKPANRKIRQL